MQARYWPLWLNMWMIFPGIHKSSKAMSWTSKPSPSALASGEVSAAAARGASAALWLLWL